MSPLVKRWLERSFPGIDTELFFLLVPIALLLVGYYAATKGTGVPAVLVGFVRSSAGWSRMASLQFASMAWMHLLAVGVLLLVPFVWMFWSRGMTPRSLGFRVKGAGREFALVVCLYLAFLPVIWYFSTTPSFKLAYPRLPAARNDAEIFLFFQLVYLAKWVSWEFFFRGFMLFGLERKLGGNAVLVSTLAFALMHIPKPIAELLASVPAGLLLCWLALRARSILPGVLLHWTVAGTMELLACSFWR